VILGPRFLEKGDSPDFGHACSNRTHKHVAVLVDFCSASSEGS